MGARMRTLLTALGLVLCSGAGFSASNAAAEKRAFSIFDVYRVTPLSAPKLSPDGQWLLYTQRRWDLDTMSSSVEIWRMRSDGSQARMLTQSKKGDSEPQFTPDGKSVLFVSSRSGSSQLWLMPFDGGEPRQLTDFAPGLSGPVFSRDGRYIAAATELWPKIGIDAEKHKAFEAEREAGKLNVHVSDKLMYRHWTDWEDGKLSQILLIEAQSGKVLKNLTPVPFDAPTWSMGGGRGYAFSADGRSLYYNCNHDENAANSTNTDIWQVAIEGEITPSSAKNLTDGNEGWDGAPLISPDGRFMAYLSQEQAGYESDLKRLGVMELATGETRWLTKRGGFDDMIDEFVWSADSRSLVFQAEHKGRTPLYRAELSSGKITPLLTQGYIDGWELEPQGKGIVFTSRTISRPHEIYRLDLGTQMVQALTSVHERYLAEIDVRPAEELWIPVEGGYKVHCFVVKPHGYEEGRKYPLVLNVHGGPQSQWADGWRGDWQVYAGKGCVTAFCNPTGSTGYGQDFTDAIQRDWGGRVFRDLMQVTDALEKLPFVDRERMGAMGWSYGGYMMMWMQGHTDRFRCQAAMMGLYDLPSFYGSTEELWFPESDLGGTPWTSEHYQKWNPSAHVKNFQTPALVITGMLDFRVPYTQSLDYFTALQKQGVPSRLVVFPDAGHWPGWQEMLFYYNAHVDWFHQHLGSEAPERSVLEWAEKRGVKVP
jgi:dipeptidyl aminopeptidase/acylaminoacyl peptidase